MEIETAVQHLLTMLSFGLPSGVAILFLVILAWCVYFMATEGIENR